MAKRKANQLEAGPSPHTTSLRRSTRRKSSVLPKNAAETSRRSKAAGSNEEQKDSSQRADAKEAKESPPPRPTAKAKPTKQTDASGSDANNDTVGSSSSAERSYWLMKAEPDSRLENGVDVKFSIDDLASCTEPEPWDGIRNYVARNNLRVMKKGELAFFYQSNCKEPGIVGTMEIVQEHSPDLSAHDPKAPYYDPSSKPQNPKWSVVHVEFRSKFKQPIGLKELREMGRPGNPLENMQMLKQSRLSVSRVSPAEWEHLIDLVKQRDGGLE
ncbi:PUA-like domain-containing protein [Xylariaceae sp. FL0662B]|nr:PUA-like domain-containing protein [Xylariaceae sp. FL0662B]